MTGVVKIHFGSKATKIQLAIPYLHGFVCIFFLSINTMAFSGNDVFALK